MSSPRTQDHATLPHAQNNSLLSPESPEKPGQRLEAQAVKTAATCREGVPSVAAQQDGGTHMHHRPGPGPHPLGRGSRPETGPFSPIKPAPGNHGLSSRGSEPAPEGAATPSLGPRSEEKKIKQNRKNWQPLGLRRCGTLTCSPKMEG